MMLTEDTVHIGLPAFVSIGLLHRGGRAKDGARDKGHGVRCYLLVDSGLIFPSLKSSRKD
jgi:hypothetical protein